MNVLRNSDYLFERANSLTKKEVLDYFEDVRRCLDQRRQSGADLQRDLDRISSGSTLVNVIS